MKIKQEEKERIKEKIVDLLRENPRLFTCQIAKALSRDEEFILKLLKTLSKEGRILEIKRNKNKIYIRRRRWIVNESA